MDLDFLSTIPIFGFFTREELKAGEPLFREVVYNKGDVVVRLGEPGDTFYVVLDGELEVWDASDPPRQTGKLARADYFGEMALLQGGKRTATVTVSHRAKLLAIDKPAFDKLFLKNPKAIEYFARVLSKRLAGLTKGERLERDTTTISVASRKGLKGETLVAYSLASLLQQLTGHDVLFVEVRHGEAQSPGILRLLSDDLSAIAAREIPGLKTPATGPATLDIALPPDLSPAAYGTRLSNLVSRVGSRFRFVVFDLGSSTAGLIESASDYSDIFVGLVDAPGDALFEPPPRWMTVYKVINRFNPASRPVPVSHCDPFVLPRSPALGRPPREAARYVCANARSPEGLPLHRLARKILGSSVGLALGGGAAFGLAHLGVLKVLEANHVPVDLVAGCSQGSIIAVGYAAGLPVREMIEIANELGVRRNFLFASDPTFFTQPGILAGQRFVTMMRPYLRGKETFEHLVMPCRTVATDIQSGERVAIGDGRLDAAFRASSSVPMVMAPLQRGDRVLVDGGVTDPVPAEVATEMGADLTIAVNVVPRMKRGVESILSYWYRQVNAFNPLTYLSDAKNVPSLFDIVMNSMQILQYELGNFKAITADVLINPDLSDFTWIEYYRASELIARGAEAAERAMPAIEKMLTEKIRPAEKPAPATVSA